MDSSRERSRSGSKHGARLGSKPPRDGWNRSDVEEHIRDEHSTFTWLLEPMLEKAGFEIEDASYSPDKLFARYVARAI